MLCFENSLLPLAVGDRMSTVLYENENHKCVKFDGLVDGGDVQSFQLLIVAGHDIWRA